MPRQKTNKDVLITVCKNNGKWYLRLTPKTTTRFPHGISLATQFETQKEVEDFKNDVFDFLKEGFGVNEVSVEGLYPTLEELEPKEPTAEIATPSAQYDIPTQEAGIEYVTQPPVQNDIPSSSEIKVIDEVPETQETPIAKSQGDNTPESTSFLTELLTPPTEEQRIESERLSKTLYETATGNETAASPTTETTTTPATETIETNPIKVVTYDENIFGYEKNNAIKTILNHIYNVSGWSKRAGFINDVKEHSIEEFTDNVNRQAGADLQSQYGLTNSDAPLTQFFILAGVTDLNEMSWIIISELHKYAMKDISENGK